MSRRPGRSRRVSSGLPAWAPTNIGGLILWLRADLGVTLNVGDVSAWADQSGAGNNCTQGTGANQPVFNASDANLGSRPSISFSSTESLVCVNSITLGWIAVVARHPSTSWTGTPVMLAVSAAGTNAIPWVGGAGTANWLTGGGATMAGARVRNGVSTNVALGTANQPFLFEITPNTPAAGQTQLGNYSVSSPSNPYGGAITEVFGATAVPSAATLTALRAYVARRYGFTI